MHLLLLHGAIGASTQLAFLGELLPASFHIHNLNFSGHGGRPISSPFSIEAFATEVEEYMYTNSISSAAIFGYSMGGYVGMYLALHKPHLVSRIVTLATKFHWDKETAAREVKMLDPEKITQKIPAFAEILSRRHAPAKWHDVLSHTAGMMRSMGDTNPINLDQFATINQPVLLMVGDKDKMVSIDETLSVFRQLPNANLCIMPDTQHPIEQLNRTLLIAIIDGFLKQ